MLSADNKKDRVARRYGRAFFEAALETDQLQPVIKDVEILQNSFATQKWEKLQAPGLPYALRSAQLKKIFAVAKFNTLTANFLQVLYQNRRINLLKEILEAFNHYLNEQKGITEVVVETATDLNKNELSTLQKYLETSFKKKITLRTKENKSLLSGVVVHLNNYLIDASLKTSLNKLRQAMKG